MGSSGSARTRRLLRVLALSVVAISGLATWALAAGPGGWDHLGQGTTAGSDSLNGVASAMYIDAPIHVIVGGDFTDAGGRPDGDRFAFWDGDAWGGLGTAPSDQISNGRISALARSPYGIYAGGSFQNAGGDPDADFLAVYGGGHWSPACTSTVPGPAITGNVTSLLVVGPTLYVGGSFQDGAGIPSADYLLACDLRFGTASTVVDPTHTPFSGSVYALAADSEGTLYAGGKFTDLQDIDAADNVAYLKGGGWHAMGTGGVGCGCAVTDAVRGLTTVGTDAYIGTDANDVAGIAQADHVARWNGSAWGAVGAGTGGANGWFPTTTSINALVSDGSHLFATGSFLDANGDPRADNIAWFDGSAWHPVGSDGAGDGPWSGTGLALGILGRTLYAAGSFTSAGGDPQAHSVASFPLSQIIAYPTPTVTPGPSAVATPTVTAGPSAVPTPTVTPSPDTSAPKTSLRAARINHAKRRATFRFGSSEAGSKFLCKLDKKSYRSCASPKSYTRLKRGKHVFRVKARDRAGNVDRTPTVKRFRIKRR